MPVVELAKLRMRHGKQQVSLSLSQSLLHAKRVMEEASGYPFTFLQSIEDPNILLIIGAWPSVEFHVQEFIPGPSNKELLELLKDEIDVDWMFHIDIRPNELRLPPKGAITSISRYFVRASNRTTFEAYFSARKRDLETNVDQKMNVKGGWRLDKDMTTPCPENDEEEFVSFTAFDSHSESHELAQDQEDGVIDQIRGCVIGIETFCARTLDL